MLLKVLGFAQTSSGNQANETQHRGLATAVPDRSTQPTQNHRTGVSMVNDMDETSVSIICKYNFNVLLILV